MELNEGGSEEMNKSKLETSMNQDFVLKTAKEVHDPNTTSIPLMENLSIKYIHNYMRTKTKI